MTKQYFAAGNTGSGFVNCFEHINEAGGFMYILKGGAGTGKSTLMKKIGNYFEAAGKTVEYFYCSSDPKSLDGVRIVDSNTAIVDGTAPHITEAKMPGVIDKIINLGEFIGDGVKTHKDKILELNAIKKDGFSDMYACIAAASKINAVKTKSLSQITDRQKLLLIADEIYDNIHSLQTDKKYKRKLFLSAISTEGIVDFVAQNNYKSIISLSGNTFATEQILNILATKLDSCSVFCDILCPDAVEAIAIGDILICKAKRTSKYNGPTVLDIELQNTITGKIYNDNITNCDTAIESMLTLASNSLKVAKHAHMQIEEFYYPYMDFGGLDIATQKLIDEITLLK